ncbi:hypothetical protein [Picosynechococcus sp. OG1]|uniref:hypothetical protein n=1 Tax=Picosynechococcus sp. OG1 TaxID=1938863 RepID=UPI0030DDBF53
MQVPPSRRRQRLITGAAVGLVLAVGAGLGYGRYYIYQRLSPQIEQQLNKQIDRPINLGSVQGFSLGDYGLARLNCHQRRIPMISFWLRRSPLILTCGHCSPSGA